VEDVAEERARLLIEKKKKELLPDDEIWEKALMYESLIDLDIKTMVWIKPDAPVGPHRRGKPLDSHSLLNLRFGSTRTKRRSDSIDL